MAVGLTPFLILTSGLRLAKGDGGLTRVGEMSGECMLKVLYLTADNSATYLGDAMDLIAIGDTG